MGTSWTQQQKSISYEEWEKKQPKGYFIFEKKPNSIHGEWIYYVETIPPTIIRKKDIIDTSFINWDKFGYVKNRPWIYLTDENEESTILPLDVEPEECLTYKHILKRS